MTPGMICKRCGSALLMGAEYCTKCGAPIPGLPAKRKKWPALVIAITVIAGILIIGAIGVGGILLLSSIELKIPLTLSLTAPGADEKPAASIKQDEGTIGDYHVKILSAATGTDIGGSPAVIVTYEWTNNGSEPVAFASAFSTTIYQKGIELNQPIWVSPDNSTGLMDFYNKIQPGITQTVKCAYASEDNSEVSVEVTGADGKVKVVKVLPVTPE